MSKKRQRYPNVNKFFAYSTDQSKPFWNAVNSLNNDADKQEMFGLGVALQNLESYVLKQLQFKIVHEKEEVNVCNNTECLSCSEGHCNHNRSEVCYDRKIL
jgi:hypothetical protein